ncbi:hypothetical protein LE977_25780 [Mycobacterium avium]|uniref:hypothetical protein n=1 Tax=Mycobacterium avium TaxID=1764 RepID=UPI00293B2A04|nr:hypothetical protein [Mycobacterium avium]MDV3219773.1 hypothetical protein [Mycobacterium avium]
MINLKCAVLLLPVYIAAMITIDIVFKSAHIAPSKPLPVWIVAGFIASAIVVVAVGIWYFTQRRSSKVTPKREGLLHDQVTVSVTRPDWPVWS